MDFSRDTSNLNIDNISPAYKTVLYSDDWEFSLRIPPCDIKPFKEQLKRVFFSEKELFPHELLCLFTEGQGALINDSRIGFWAYDYGMQNADYYQMLDKLHTEGYLEIAPVEFTIRKQVTVDLLKQILKKVGQSVSGKKNDLIDRLLTTFSRDALENMFPQRYLVITEKGKRIISNNYQILFIHKNKLDNLTIWNISAIIPHASTEADCFLPIYEYLGQRAQVHRARGKDGLDHSCQLYQSKISEKYQNGFPKDSQNG